jgi:hypothetical protein
MAASTGTAPAPRGQRQPAGQQGRGSSALRSPVTWIIVLGIALAAGAYLLYKRSSSSSAAGTSTDTSDTPAGTQNPDWSGEIATLQTEIGDLQSTMAQEDEQSKTSGSGTTSSTADKVRVPGVVGDTQEAAFSAISGAGLKPASATKPVKGRTLTVTSEDPKAGTEVDKGSTVRLTSKLTPPNWPPAHKSGSTKGRAPASTHGSTAATALHKHKGGRVVPVGKAKT